MEKEAAVNDRQNGLALMGDDYLVSKERMVLSMEAVFELCQISYALIDMEDKVSDEVRYLFRGIALRTRQLGETLISAMYDEAETLESIEKSVIGKAREPAVQ